MIELTQSQVEEVSTACENLCAAGTHHQHVTAARRNSSAWCRHCGASSEIRTKLAMAAYARQAKDTELIQFATEIKVRAERKCGEMLRESAERGERATRGNPKMSNGTTFAPTLIDIGITRDQSSRYQQLAAMPDEHFETAVATAETPETVVTRTATDSTAPCYSRPKIVPRQSGHQ